MGSYPTQRTPAFSQDWHLGRRWSQRFFRRRHRLQAETLRKDEDEDEATVAVEWAGDVDGTVVVGAEGFGASREEFEAGSRWVGGGSEG